MSLANRSVNDALRSWAELLHCPLGYLESPRVACVERETTDDAEAAIVMTFTRDAVGLVSLPSGDARHFDLDANELQELIAMTRAESKPGALVQMHDATFVVDDEPVSLAVADAGTLMPERAIDASVVYDPNPVVLDMLRHQLTTAEWELGGGANDSPHRIGVLAGGVLVALASVARPVGHLARIRVVVAPGYRRRGYGQMAVRRMAQHVLNQGLLPFCRVAVSDVSAWAMAGAVGFVSFARSLSMRLSTLGAPEPRLI